MNREIKLRAWQKDKKVMMDVKEYDFENKEIWAENITGAWYKDCKLEIMQYTGLKDKNGKEIYEGDIVSSYVQTGKESSRSIIVWEDEELYSGWNIKVIKDFYPPNKEGCIIPISRNDVMDYEVIGNIYENSELLEVE